MGDIWRSAKFGYTQGAGADEALEIAAKGTGSSDKDIAEFIAAQEKLAGLGQTDEMRKFDKDMAAAGGGVLGFLKSLVKNDGIIPQLAVQTMTQLLNPASLAAAGTTIAAGAGLGATTGSVGGPLGGAAGALLGGAASLPWAYATAGATLETAMSFAEFMQEEVAKKGLKFDNEGVRAVLEDDDAMFNIRAKSLGRGGIIGIVDRISVGLGGKLIKGMKLSTPKGKVAQKVMHSKLGQVGAAAGTEAVGGGTGEALARLGVGQEMDVKEIGFEAIGGIGRTPFTYAYGQVMSKPKYTIKNKIGEEEAIDQQEVARIIKESSDKDFAAMNLEIVNDPLLKAEAQKRKADLREESAILKELYDAGVTDPDLVAELVILEQSKKKLEGNETTAAKQRLQEIEQQISDLLTGKRIPPKKDSKEDELATQETIEAQREEELEEHIDKFFTEDKETGNRVGPNPDTQPELYNEEIKERDAINKKYDELLTEKNKKDAIQEQSTETMDVQEQTQDGRKVGERDAPVDEVTRESETEIETDTQTPTQEEVVEESRDLESIIKGTAVAPKGEPMSVTQEQEVSPVIEEEVVEEEVTTPMEADVVENTQEKTVKVPHAKTKKKVTLAGKKSKVSPNVFIVEESVEAVDPIYKNKEAQAKQESLIIRAVEKAGKAIRKILGTKIILHRTEASYNKATGQNSKGSQGKAGSRGMYNASNNVIHINIPHAKKRTVAHEIFHALVMSKFKSAKLKALTDRMVAAVRKEITDPALQKKLDKFIALNKKLDPEYAAKFEAEEYLAELTGILAENYNKLPAKAQNIIQRWVKKIQKIIADATGYKTEITSPLEILNVFAQRISEGKEISEETVSQFEKIAKKKPAKKKAKKETTEKKETKEEKEGREREEAYEQREKELEREIQEQTGVKGAVNYIQQQIHDYFGGITRQDFDQFGDRNLRSRALNFLLRKDASPLDAQAQELSEMAGVEITPQDFIDYMLDKVNNPGKYAQSRTQLMDLTPKQKVIQIAERHGIKANGFFPANLWDPTGLRKQLSKEGYGLVESRIREGYRAGEVAGYYISKPGGGKFNLPTSDRFQMLFNKDDSPTDIIKKARELGFKDEAIKDYLQRVEKLAAKDVKALLQSPTPQQQTIPVAFGNVEGGMVVGEKIYNEINTKVEVFKNFGKENKPNNAEVRAEGLRLLEQNESFKKQPKITQKELISAYDRSLQTTANKEVQKKIGAIRKELGAYKKGKTDLEKIKGKVSQFIRQALPVDKDTPYTKADVIALMNAVAKATDKTLLTTIDRVVQRVDKIRDAATKKEIAKIRTLVEKKAQTRKTESKKRRGKGLDAAGQQFFRSVKNILNLAIKGDIVALEQIRESLEAAEVIIGQGKDAVVVDTQEMLGKELRGEELTTKEQQVLEQLYALDTFGDIANMSLEDVKNLYQGLKDVRAESIKRLGINRLRRAQQRAKLDEQADAEVKENYPFLFHEDGTLKNKNDLDQDARGIWNDFQNLRLWSSLKKFVNRYEFTSGIGIADFFRKRIQHLGTLMNLLDNVAKNNYFFSENVYNRLNRMESRYLEGEQRETDSKESGLSKIAESMGIKGTKWRSAYSKWKSQIPQGARDLIIKGRKVSLTIDEMMRIYALSKNDVQRSKLEAMGYDQSILEEIERVITPTATEFIDKIVEYLSNDYFESVNSVYRQVHDVNLGYVENYFPTRTIAPNVDGMITDIEGANFSGIFNAEYSSAFKERVDKTSEIDLGAGFTSVLETHIRSMERFKAFAQDTQILNNIFKNKAINTLITELGTKQTMKNLINLTVNPNSGLKQEKVLVEKVLSKFTSFALAFKFMQIPKQATSFVNAYEEYSFRGKGKQTPGLDTIGFMLDMAWVIATMPYQVKKAWNISPDFRNRLKKGLEGDIYGLETGSRTFKPITKGLTKAAKIKKVFKKGAGSPTILGDVMGVMGYMANYNANIRSGMSKAEAVQTFANYNATQQSRRNTDKNTLQLSGTELTRVFTMFGSTLFLQMNKVMSATTNIMRSLKAKKAPRLKDIRALALNFAIANMLFVATANMFKLIDDDEDREEAMKKIKDAGMGLNLLYQIPLFGGASEMIIRKIQGDRGKADDVVNPFKAIWWKINRAMKEDTKWKVFLPVFELIIGAQMDPFIALYNYFAGEGDDMKNIYDMLGVSPSYQPKGGTNEREFDLKIKPIRGDVRKKTNVKGGGGRTKDIRQKANIRE